MTLLETWVQTPAARALGWTLVHSLWQGAVAALAVGAVLAAARSPRVRYAAACLALAGMLVAGGVTFLRQNPPPRAEAVPAVQARVHAPAPGFDRHAAGSRAPWRAADFLPWLAPFWVAGVCIFYLRGVGGWMVARRLRRTGVCCAPEPWQERCGRLRARLRVSRPAVVLESCLAEVPVVIGCVRPVILLPLGMLAGMPPAQVELILLHELAHVRRYDDLVNLLQTFAEGLLFYHPAVWWIARVIRAERENCCDDVVVAAGGSAGEYARALAELEQSRLAAWEPALAATGGNLAQRIRRLLYPAQTPRVAWVPILCTGLLVLGAAVLPAWQEPPKPPQPPAGGAVTAGKTRLFLMDLAPYAKWLAEDAGYIITDEERAEFRKLQTDADRERFIERFWQRRDPTPGTPENEFQVEHYRRIAYAGDRYTTPAVPGWKSDRGKTYIIFGPPDEIESHPGGTPETSPFEIWRYRYIESVQRGATLTFIDATLTGEFHMTDTTATGPTAPAAADAIYSSEPDSQATVRVAPSGKVSVSFPLDSGAKQYNIYGRTTTKSGRIMQAFEDTVRPCRANPALRGCQEREVYLRANVLGSGDYVFHGVVKELPGSSIKTYTVNFSVK